jgi:hypothetical protein
MSATSRPILPSHDRVRFLTILVSSSFTPGRRCPHGAPMIAASRDAELRWLLHVFCRSCLAAVTLQPERVWHKPHRAERFAGSPAPRERSTMRAPSIS